MNVPFLGRIPLDPSLTIACDQGRNFLEQCANSQSLKPLKDFVQQLLQKECSSDGTKSDNTTQPLGQNYQNQ
jgi:hypothetical protein